MEENEKINIDVSKCNHYCKDDKCGNTCLWFGTSCEWVGIKECYYKQLHQLKSENEGLKKYIDRASIVCIINLLKCLDDIEEICNNEMCLDNKIEEILVKIKGKGGIGKLL